MVIHSSLAIVKRLLPAIGLSAGLVGLLCLLIASPAAASSGAAAAVPRVPQLDSPALTSQLPITVAVICPDVVAPPGVDTLDIAAVAARWPFTAANPDPDNNPNTPNYEQRYDINQDGSIDILDIMLTSAQWNTIGTPDGIEITSVPPYGSWYVPLRGRVGCVTPADYKVAVYVYMQGWWTKPTFASPLTPIQSDGTWSTNVTTGGCDNLATRYAAFLLPNGAPYTTTGGSSDIPPGMFVYPHVIVERLPGSRTIEFSGSTWVVKSTGTCTMVGPGPNYFSDDPSDVFVDQAGRLHLRIVNRNGRWWSSEVINTAPLAYGAYTFTLASRVDLLDPNAVVGLFTWDELASTLYYREIDVEFSRWGVPGATNNAQYVVAPWYSSGHRHQFFMQLNGDISSHRFVWQPGAVQFDSYQGTAWPPAPSDWIQSWLYTGSDVPPATGSHMRINAWLNNGVAPTNGQPVELIVESFASTPLAQ